MAGRAAGTAALAPETVAGRPAAGIGTGRGGRVAEVSAGDMAAADGDVLVRYEAVYGRGEMTPGTRRLLLAVLEEGIRTLQANARGTGARATRLRRDAMHWLLGTQPENVFAFASICDALDLDAGRLRGRILDALAPR